MGFLRTIAGAFLPGSVIAFFLLYRQLGPKKANRIPGTVRARVPQDA